jgi:hypothetical protein
MLNEKPIITSTKEPTTKDLAHVFTDIDDVVKTRCVASLDVVDKSTSNRGKKIGNVWLCIFNLVL